MSKWWFSLGYFLLIFYPLVGQSEWGKTGKFGSAVKFEPILSFQFWSTYTQGLQVFNSDLNIYEPAENRLNFQFRRARFGFKGQMSDQFRFTFIGSFDLAGRDLLSATSGGLNTGSLPGLGLWDAFGEYKLSKKSEVVYLVFGWFRPQFSRESMTAVWATSSFEKAMSQNYIRTHLVGIGSGRAAGVNFGGLLKNKKNKIFGQYNIGLFTPQWLKYSGNSAGFNTSILKSARLVYYLGDPEMTKYGISYQTNYFNKRKGLSLGISYADQGQTDLFDKNTAFQPDILFNWGSFNLDAEWNFMQRVSLQQNVRYPEGAGHIRFSNNVQLFGLFLEPTFMFVKYKGGLTIQEQILASSLSANAGTDENIDFGVNIYFNQNKFKVAFHHTWNRGNMGEGLPGFSQNLYFRQNGLGAIKRGNYWGLGINGIF
jgi:hypothetical protein